MKEGLNSARHGRRRKSAATDVLWIASIALVYFLTAHFSLTFLFQPDGVASIWPASGIYLSALLLTRRTLWPWLIGILLVVDFIAQHLAGTPSLSAALYAVVLSGDALLSAWLLQRFVSKQLAFERVRDVVGFLLLSVVLSNMLWSLLAAFAAQWHRTTTFWDFWKWWAASDGVGNLLLTPFILSWAGLIKRGLGPWKPNRILEGAALFLPMAVFNYAAFRLFRSHTAFSLLHAYITFPFLLWAGLRFGTRGVSSALLILASIALHAIATGHDTALSPQPVHWSSILLVQIYLVILALPSLLLAGVVSERQQAKENLRQGQERYRLLFEANPDPMWVYDLESLAILEVNNSAIRHYGYSREEFLALTIKDIRPQEDVPVLLDRLKQLSPHSDYSGEWRHCKKNGSIINVEIFSHQFCFAGRPSRLVLACDITERKRADEAQKEARRLLRGVLDTVPVRVFWKDRDGRFLGSNLPFAKDAGLNSPDELIGKSDFEMSWREQAELYRADDREVMASGCPKVGYEETQTTPSGEQIWLRTSKTPLKDAAGNIIGVLGTYEDITPAKRAEQVLRAREQMLSESQRIAGIGSWSWNLKGPVLWTEETYRIFGVSPDSFTPTIESFVDLLHPEDRLSMRRWIEQCMNGECPEELTCRIVLPDGSIRFMCGRGELKYDAEGKPASMAGTAQDITERKQAEEALQRSEALLRKSQEIGHIGSWEMDAVANKLIWSDEVYQIFGVSPKEFTPSYDTFMQYVHPKDREAVNAAWSISLRRKQDTYEIEHRIIRRPSGEIRVLHEKCEHVKDSSGRIIRSIGMVQDITDRKRIEYALREATEQLARSNQDLEKKVYERTAELKENIADLEAFSYTIAHDMRAPLRAILGFTELLRRESGAQFSERGTEYFNQITESARRMDRLIQDVLNLSRVTRTELKLEPVDVDKVLRGILNSYPTFQQNAQIHVQGPLPVVQANEAALTQCISNLLSNAVKFVSPGVTPRVEVWAERRDGAARPTATPADTSGMVRLWFADNGIGIAPDQQERIFEIFQRVDTTYEGTGIGLAIVRKAMHQMGGEVGLESQLGKGSRFWLEFPQPPPQKENSRS